jgi:hypothetical protein
VEAEVVTDITERYEVISVPFFAFIKVPHGSPAPRPEALNLHDGDGRTGRASTSWKERTLLN